MNGVVSSYGVCIYVSPMGDEVLVGPQFRALMNGLAEDLSRSKRTKAYKAALVEMARIESAIDVMAEAAWLSGGLLVETP